jgi:hypothetical protein
VSIHLVYFIHHPFIVFYCLFVDPIGFLSALKYLLDDLLLALDRLLDVRVLIAGPSHLLLQQRLLLLQFRTLAGSLAVISFLQILLLLEP